jgi:hypothetical protein
MEIIAGIFGIILFLFILHALSLSIEGKNLIEEVIDFGKEIYYFFKNKQWRE